MLQQRLARLASARLYLVTDAREGGGGLAAFLDAALGAGVDVVQLRDKRLGDDELLEAAAAFRAAADRHGALFVLNDRPDLAARAGADGVHVGQDDMTLAQAREAAGPGLLVGRSTHSPEQFAAEAGADYRAVGPVWETPTKPGRPAAGLAYVRHAAAHGGESIWFAIGGIDQGSVGEVVAAGARRIVVVRAITQAPDPHAAAQALKAALTLQEAEVGLA